jgi:tetratricopeptide (TPR) repeat protein
MDAKHDTPKGKGGPVPSPAPSGKGRTSPWKVALFIVAASLAPFLIAELILALVGVQPILIAQDPYVGFSSHIPLFVARTQPDGTSVMVTADNKQDYFNHQEFLPAKSGHGAYRIFCMGGSTTNGRPYNDTTSFCGWLREMLPLADPTHQWDVVNAGGVSYASYRVAKLMEELARYEPDLFIIYSGHNEFLERRTYGPILEGSENMREFRVLLSRTRVFTVIQRMIGGGVAGQGGTARSEAQERVLLPGEVDTILEHSLGPEAYHRDDATQEQALHHYRHNLTRMISIARAAGADIIFVTPASNLRDCSPFKSEHRDGLDNAARQRWEALLSTAEQARNETRWDDALNAVDDAAAIDDRYAHLHYLRGKVLLALERYDEAGSAFKRARDEDVCPLRALTAMQGIVADVATEHGVPLVDFEAFVENHSPNGIPGESFFLDHVHPTIEGHRQLALLLLNLLADQGVLHPAESWDDQAIAEVKAKVEGTLDAEAKAIALRNLSMVLGWAGKAEEARELALRAIETWGMDAPAYCNAGQNSEHVGRYDEAIEYYRQALEVQPGYFFAYFGIGDVKATQGKYEEAVENYSRALELNPGFVECHSNMGRALAALGRQDEALAHYRIAVKIDPEFAVGHCNLAKQLMKSGEIEEALDHFRRALHIDPGFTAAHSSMAGALTMAGRYDEALAHYKEAARLNPNDPVPYARTSWILASHPSPASRNPQVAIRFAEHAATLGPKDQPLLLDALGVAYASAGRFDDALRVTQKALDSAVAQGSRRAENIRQRLALYAQRQPYTLPTPEQ